MNKKASIKVYKWLKYKNISVKKAAETMNYSRPNLNNFLNGHASLSIGLALKLEKHYGFDGLALLIQQLKDDYRYQKKLKG
jgi:plasmid maintenance system antidote protein VapI